MNEYTHFAVEVVCVYVKLSRERGRHGLVAGSPTGFRTVDHRFLKMMTRSGRRLHPETCSSPLIPSTSSQPAMSIPSSYKTYILAKKPVGEINDEVSPAFHQPAKASPPALTLPLVCIRIQTFRLEERQIPELEDGQVLAKTLYLSNDPAQRSKQALERGSRRNRSLGDTHTDCCIPFTSLD